MPYNLPIQWFLVCSQNCVPITTINSGTFLSHNEEILCSLAVTTPHFSFLFFFSSSFFLKAPGPWQPRIYTLVSIDVPTLNISYKWKIQYVVFVTSFFNLTCFQGSSILQPPSVLPFFLFMGQTILTVWIYLILHLSIS